MLCSASHNGPHHLVTVAGIPDRGSGSWSGNTVQEAVNRRLPVTTKNTERSLTLRLPQSLHDELKEAAEREDRSLSQLIRVASRHYLHAECAQVRQA